MFVMRTARLIASRDYYPTSGPESSARIVAISVTAAPT
jgi:hypothetical protein